MSPGIRPELKLRLLEWYRQNARDLPWRHTKDPYAIWVSEVMLQQTRVDVVLPYYQRWMERFPNLPALARADEQEVLALWQGLGYYRRARNLLAAAKTMAEMPSSHDDLLAIPGIGPYTAAAIASISTGEPRAVMDGNVERVFARFTANPNHGGRLHREAWTWAAQNLVHDRASDWNQALMELGATICTPRNPNCAECPLFEDCLARRSDPEEFPTPSPKRQVVELHRNYWIPVLLGRFGLQQIPEGQWWGGMWGFPETSAADPAPGWASRPGPLKPFTHTVTHHRIRVQGHVCEVDQPVEALRFVSVAQAGDLPLPSPQRKLLRLASAVLSA